MEELENVDLSGISTDKLVAETQKRVPGWLQFGENAIDSISQSVQSVTTKSMMRLLLYAILAFCALYLVIKD